MKRSTFATYLTAVVLALGAVPALAQDPPSSNGSASGGRPSGGSGGGGSTAGSRPSGGGDGGGGGSASSAGSSSSSGSSGMSMPSTGGSSFSDFGSRPRAPERRGGDYAVPRGGGDTGFVGRSVGRSSSPSPTSARSNGIDAIADQRRAVPAYSRPRDGRQVTGEAVERGLAPAPPIAGLPIGGGGGYWYGYPYYGYPYGPWYGGYGYGLGYFYDPFGYYGYYSPYNDYGYSSGYGSGSYSYGSGRSVGQLRLKVNPKHGQVYVDGYFAGEVDNFDGAFQRLSIESGAHKVEIRADGFETVTFDVVITPGETVTYKGEMKPIR